MKLGEGDDSVVLNVFELKVEPSPGVAMFFEPRLFMTQIAAKEFAYKHCEQAFAGRVSLPWQELDAAGRRLRAVSNPAEVTYYIERKDVHR